MKPYKQLFHLLLLVLLISSIASCKKDVMMTSGGSLKFSTDTLNFDTVFTQYTSFTLQLKIFNPQSQKIKVSSVRLEQGNQSYFTLNVDGQPGNNIQNIEVAANDSFYVFATVKIDPTNENNPFIIEDKLIATLNGNDYSIPIYAYGQNAYYLTDSVIDHDMTWGKDKPYVILHSAAVDVGKTLTLLPGCRVYMHQDSRLYVLGKLLAQGTKQDSIIFQGNRLDRAYFGYQGYPGEWGGIYIDSSSTGNVLDWVILRNCGNNAGGGLPFAMEVYGRQGIATQLSLNHVIVENSIGYGLLSFTGNIKAQNSLFHTCGSQALAILQGGQYSFDNCNFIIYGTNKVSHINQPTVAVLNYFDITQTQRLVGDLQASFRNCIIDGSLENELFCNKEDMGAYQVSFTNCLIKNKEVIPAFVTVTQCKLNDNPLYNDLAKWDFRPKEGSPLIGAGTNILGLGNDLADRPWTFPLDIGCYKY